LRAALAFLTPFGRARTPDGRTLDWFPAVGAGLGLVLGGWWWVVSRAWPAPVAAALVVAADLALTGLLHLDGLVDAADGLLPHLERARRLEVMATPDAGAFGVGVAAVVLLGRWAALAALRPGALLLAGLWCGSRTAMAIVARTQPYARPGGLASAFAGPARLVPLAAGTAAAIAGTVAWRPLPGAAAVAAGAAAAAAVVVVGRRRLGGYTGDVLGATAMMFETAGLVAAAARW